jgi:hypothetical protein
MGSTLVMSTNTWTAARKRCDCFVFQSIQTHEQVVEHCVNTGSGSGALQPYHEQALLTLSTLQLHNATASLKHESSILRGAATFFIEEFLCETLG